jgi:hypothetical protein
MTVPLFLRRSAGWRCVLGVDARMVSVLIGVWGSWM